MPRSNVPPLNDADYPPVGTGTTGDIIAVVTGGQGLTATMRDAQRRRSSTITEREHRALELLAVGASTSQIATVLSIGRGAADKLIQKALAKRALEIRTQVAPYAAAVYYDRLEKLFMRWMPLAMGNLSQGQPPDEKAANVVLGLMDRYARFMGTDAPVQIEGDVTVHAGPTTDERAAFVTKLLGDLDEVQRRKLAVDAEVIDEQRHTDGTGAGRAA